MNVNLVITAYALVVVAFLIFSYAGIYHLRRYGYAGDLTKPIIIIYSLLSVTVLVVSITALIFEIAGGI